MRLLLISYVAVIASMQDFGECANLCEGVIGCSCRKDYTLKQGLGATCSNVVDPRLEDLPMHNITKLYLKEITLNNTSLKVLRNFNLSNQFKMHTIQPINLDWKWLPDTCKKVSFTLPYSRPPLKNLPNFTCTTRLTQNITSLHLFYLQYENIPECIPNTLRSIQLVNAPLNGFDSGHTSQSGDAPVKDPMPWPERLVHLYIKNANFTTIGERVFRNASDSLSKITIGSCERPMHRFPSLWPPKGAVSILIIMNCKINETKPSDFDRLQNLEYLSFLGNELTTVPLGLPASLGKLVLNYNSISDASSAVTWGALTNLKYLQFDNNLLRSVPLNLPASLIHLSLRNNKIEFSDRLAFAHMKHLEKLDLSYNKLQSMPEGLPRTLRFYSLSTNQIVVVRSPANYEFCFNCTEGLFLNNNPWVCDQNLIRMLLWANQHPVDIQMKDKCGQPVPEDLGKVGISYILRYMSYISTTEEFKECEYTIQDLRCNSVSLPYLPKAPPSNTLTKVVITFNPNLTLIPDNHFVNQTKLITLDLDFNGIKKFPKGLPSSLDSLSLNGNAISGITNDIQPTLDRLVNLRELYLSYNQIKVIYDYQLKPLKSLKWIGLDGNPLHCDCSIFSFVEWFMNDKNIERDGASQHFVPSCVSPPARAGQRINHVWGAFEYEYFCQPPLCSWKLYGGTLNCSRQAQLKTAKSTNSTELFDPSELPNIKAHDYWLHLDLSYLDLNEKTVNLSYLNYLITLNLTGNKLKAILLASFPTSLQSLELKENEIENMPVHLNNMLPNLKTIDLRYNKIRRINSSGLLAFPLVERILLDGNPLVCDCNLRPFITYIQTNKENMKLLEQHQFGNLTCQSPAKLKGKLLLDLTEEEYCPNVIWTEITGGVVGGVIFLLLISFVIIGILYKRRKLQERKDIVKGFHDLLEKESHMNDEAADKLISIQGEVQHKYDAFVSFCSSGADEDFVFKMLQELEDVRGRKICMHERDFTPGRGIADNIVECIGLSRRVIIVISRKYATSAWCQYEVQVALAQLHKHRRGRLLIPVLLEDVMKDDNYAGSVKTILSLITGIHVPTAQAGINAWKIFWDKLEGALPDKAAIYTVINENPVYEVD
ncbi:unnamed protein product [Clavelina lepadiformis]|uniref:TIR domain-containing protein n=2 Tax=Clavelina lepadiformis TaxID=159417 RepID=A0ABP0FAR5_CLALP